jgi:hypothetical protein
MQTKGYRLRTPVRILRKRNRYHFFFVPVPSTATYLQAGQLLGPPVGKVSLRGHFLFFSCASDEIFSVSMSGC